MYEELYQPPTYKNFYNRVLEDREDFDKILTTALTFCCELKALAKDQSTIEGVLALVHQVLSEPEPQSDN